MGREASLFTRGEGDRNCPEHPSGTTRDITLRSGQASAEWPRAFHHPARVIQVERSSFRAFHYDFRDEADSLFCLKGEEALDVMPPRQHRGTAGATVVRRQRFRRGFTSAVGIVTSMSSRHKSQICFGVLNELNTLYMPYGWAHAIITLNAEGGYVCSMWYLEFPTPAARIAASRKSAEAKGRCGKRRGGKPSSSA